ncbi:MAG TPA: hypothetical protein ENK57_06340 [Polyangiaceae bacterium]|nr:hypothetical protein [Polyangiaceae bacterium]
MSGRTIVIGDVHGCADELEDLLAEVSLSDDDELFFVGDLVVRGPKPARVLSLVRRHRGRAVRGNHEHRLLRWRALRSGKGKGWKKDPTAIDRRVIDSKMLRRTAEELSDEDWAQIAAWPLWLDAHGGALRVVHAGLVPGVPIERQEERTLLYVRGIDEDGEPTELRDAGTPWGALYEGPPHVAFGHNAQRETQRHPWATGLDTGCVYGGALTALVLHSTDAIPPPHERRDVLWQVPARQTYHPVT